MAVKCCTINPKLQRVLPYTVCKSEKDQCEQKIQCGCGNHGYLGVRINIALLRLLRHLLFIGLCVGWLHLLSCWIIGNL